MSDILVVTNYWHPWNNSGAFRWLHLSKYIDFSVLTSKKPQGFYDETMPKGRYNRIYRYGRGLPAVLSGLYLSVVSVFIRADKYVYTCPPESLLFGAYVNQLLGRRVYVDMRDKIDRHTQPNKWLVPIYQWLYKKMKNVCVCMQFFDWTKPVIRHGYDVDKKISDYFDNIVDKYYDYNTYCNLLRQGMGRDYSDIKFKNYSSSSIVTIRHLNNPIYSGHNLHSECFEFEPESWTEIAEQMNEFLSR